MQFPALPIALVVLLGTLPAPAADLTATRVASGFANPVFATAPAGDTERLFVIEQNTGRVRILRLATGEILADPFLALTGGELSTGGERGLLGMAFHPNYATNGRFFLNFTGSGGQTVIREYRVSANPDRADPASGQTLLEIAQPFSNHNGGWIGFGPDGFLYIATGDGGSANDPGNRAQDITDQLLGKILRIDPGTAADGSYAVPPDNPFVGQDGDDEIWAYGLRNPWRCSFDRETGEFWIADVGQGAREEINLQPPGTGGLNYGWRVFEGNRATGLGGGSPPYVAPIHEYNHDAGLSISGGYVYRGDRYPEMDGLYLFGDYVFSTIWSLHRDADGSVSVVDRTAELTPDAGSIGSIVSFGEDGVGELYLIDHDGEIFRIGTADSVLTNLSTRARLGAVSPVAIAGFVLEGDGASDLLIRGVGPGLAGFSVPDPLADPSMEVFRGLPTGGSSLILTNDDWEEGGAGSSVAAAATAAGAFGLSPGSRDAAVVASVASGRYSEVLRSADSAGGVGLVELYALGASAGAIRAPVLRNLSTRASVETGGGVLIAGFVLEGTGSRRFLIRGVGPGLETFGVTGVVADPVLDVSLQGAPAPVAANHDWDAGGAGAGAVNAAASVGAFPLASGSLDAAVVVRLWPGAYTARVSTAGGDPGVALVEIYLLSD